MMMQSGVAPLPPAHTHAHVPIRLIDASTLASSLTGLPIQSKNLKHSLLSNMFSPAAMMSTQQQQPPHTNVAVPVASSSCSFPLNPNHQLVSGAAATASSVFSPLVEDTTNHFRIFVGDLAPEVETQKLHEKFSYYGRVTECKIIRDMHTQKPKGYGFVAFPTKEEAELAMNKMNGRFIGCRAIRTNWAVRKPPQTPGKEQKPLNYDEVCAASSDANCTIYVGGITNLNDKMLHEAFRQFGNIEEVRVFKEKGYAFVRFESHVIATRAIISMHGKDVGNQPCKCSWGKETGDSAANSASAVNTANAANSANSTSNNISSIGYSAEAIAESLNPQLINNSYLTAVNLYAYRLASLNAMAAAAASAASSKSNAVSPPAHTNPHLEQQHNSDQPQPHLLMSRHPPLPQQPQTAQNGTQNTSSPPPNTAHPHYHLPPPPPPQQSGQLTEAYTIQNQLMAPNGHSISSPPHHQSAATYFHPAAFASTLPHLIAASHAYSVAQAAAAARQCYRVYPPASQAHRQQLSCADAHVVYPVAAAAANYPQITAQFVAGAPTNNSTAALSNFALPICQAPAAFHQCGGSEITSSCSSSSSSSSSSASMSGPGAINGSAENAGSISSHHYQSISFSESTLPPISSIQHRENNNNENNSCATPHPITHSNQYACPADPFAQFSDSTHLYANWSHLMNYLINNPLASFYSSSNCGNPDPATLFNAIVNAAAASTAVSSNQLTAHNFSQSTGEIVELNAVNKINPENCVMQHANPELKILSNTVRCQE